MSFGFCVFREVATPILNPDELPGKLEWRASDTQVFMKGRHQTTHRLFNIVQRAAFGARTELSSRPLLNSL